jgi:hypothetical protein
MHFVRNNVVDIIFELYLSDFVRWDGKIESNLLSMLLKVPAFCIIFAVIGYADLFTRHMIFNFTNQ